MSIFDINYNNDTPGASKAIEWLPPDKRLPKIIAFLKGLFAPVQWLRDKYLGDYRLGTTANLWVAGTYSAAALVQWKQVVYQSLVDDNTDQPPSSKWQVYLPSFLGVNERILFNGQKLIFEYALNQYYLTNFRQPGLLGYYYPADTPGYNSLYPTGDAGHLLYSDIFTLNNPVTIAGFDVGSFDFVPAWTPVNPSYDASYKIGYKVIYSNTIYQCTTANTDATFTVGNWSSLGPVGILTSSVGQKDIGYNGYSPWQQPVPPSSGYSVGNFVTQDGFIYMSLISSNTDEPPSSNWYQLWGVGLQYPFFLGDNFTIYFPSAVYAQTNESEVRHFVDKIIPAGIIYSIKIY